MKKFYLANWPVAAFALVVFLGGFNSIGVHYTNLELPPYWGATLRLVPTALIMFLLVVLLKLPMPRGRPLLGAILFGMLNYGGFFAFIYFGLEKVQPGMSMVLLALVPLFTLIFSILHRLESFRMRALLGALISAAGVGVVFLGQMQTRVPLIYMLAIVLGAVCMAEGGVVAKLFPRSHPITTNAIAATAGAVVVFSLSVVEHEHRVLPLQAQTWAALTYLVFLGTSAIFLLYLYLLKRWPASRISYQFVLFPFITLSASAWITHEFIKSDPLDRRSGGIDRRPDRSNYL